jgi:hypothetical protein
LRSGKPASRSYPPPRSGHSAALLHAEKMDAKFFRCKKIGLLISGNIGG